MEERYTKHQTIRGSLLDGENNQILLLIKVLPFLHLTYQIKILTYMAIKKGKKLFIRVRKDTAFSRSLRDFQKENRKHLKFEKDIL